MTTTNSCDILLLQTTISCKEVFLLVRNNLKNIRKKYNLKQREIAEAVGITTSYYGMIERGVRNPTLDLAKKIAEFLNTSIEEIFFEDKNNNLLRNLYNEQTA